MDRRTFLGRSAVTILGFSAARCAYHDVTPISLAKPVRFLTPTEQHYMKNGAEGSIAGWAQPQIRVSDWSTSLEGLFDVPGTLRYADLEAASADAIELVKTMQCVVDPNGTLVSTALWRGIPLRRFLDAAGIQLGTARRLRFVGADGFRNNLPLGRIYDAALTAELPPPILVTHMNGAPLPERHGGPVRLLVPDGFGYASVKWVQQIIATDEDVAWGTYQDTGFTDDSVSPVTSKVTVPSDNAVLAPGPVELSGFAVSGVAGIERVELRVDGGAWSPAALASRADVLAGSPEAGAALQLTQPELYPFPPRAVWVPWSFRWDATPGRHRIDVRAIDRSGNEQPERDLDITNGVNAYAAVRVEVTA